jgi:hypothetical protein
MGGFVSSGGPVYTAYLMAGKAQGMGFISGESSPNGRTLQVIEIYIDIL